MRKDDFLEMLQEIGSIRDELEKQDKIISNEDLFKLIQIYQTKRIADNMDYLTDMITEIRDIMDGRL